MKVITINGFTDAEEKKQRLVGDKFEVSEERAKKLKALGFVEILDQPQTKQKKKVK